jgi:hypothetical protein
MSNAQTKNAERMTTKDVGNPPLGPLRSLAIDAGQTKIDCYGREMDLSYDSCLTEANKPFAFDAKEDNENIDE